VGSSLNWLHRVSTQLGDYDMAESSSTHPRVLRFKQVLERVGLSRSTIYDRINPASPRYDSSFPKPMKIGRSAIGWLESSISKWIETRLESRQSGSE